MPSRTFVRRFLFTLFFGGFVFGQAAATSWGNEAGCMVAVAGAAGLVIQKAIRPAR